MISGVMWAMRRTGTRERIKELLKRHEYDKHCTPSMDATMIDLFNLVQDEIHKIELCVDVEKSQEFNERHQKLLE